MCVGSSPFLLGVNRTAAKPGCANRYVINIVSASLICVGAAVRRTRGPTRRLGGAADWPLRPWTAAGAGGPSAESLEDRTLPPEGLSASN